MSRSQDTVLAVPSQTFKFEKNQLNELNSLLEEQRKNTRTVELTKPVYAMIGNDGLVKGRYRFTKTALGQLCYRLAPGLSAFLVSITSKDGKEEGFDIAASTINRTIAYRFKERLAGDRFVIDEKNGLIEGIVGRRYVYLSNHELLNRSIKFISNNNNDVEFSGAVLSGRRFMMQYTTKKPAFCIDGSTAGYANSEPFFGGYHFSNSEVGECAIRAATVIVRQICLNGAIGSIVEGGKLVHVKQEKFEQKFHALMDGVKKKSRQYTDLKDGILRLMGSNLGLGIDKDEHKHRVSFIKQRLRRGGLSINQAKRGLSRTLLGGSYDLRPLSEASIKTLSAADQKSRTEFDLFNAITYESKFLPVDQREKSENLAHKMVLGQVKFIEA